jgi:hypothetical protein
MVWRRKDGRRPGTMARCQLANSSLVGQNVFIAKTGNEAKKESKTD